MLPPHAVRQIKRGSRGRVWERYASASVLFTNVYGFDDLAETLDSRVMLLFLNSLFSYMDTITAVMARFGAYKVETIGTYCHLYLSM